jgi:hypothetical protein
MSVRLNDSTSSNSKNYALLSYYSLAVYSSRSKIAIALQVDLVYDLPGVNSYSEYTTEQETDILQVVT